MNSYMNTTAASELQELLVPLDRGGPLDLAVLAALAAAKTPTDQCERQQQEHTAAATNAALEQSHASIFALFEKHVGPYNDVINNAIRITKWALDEEEYYQSWNCAIEHPGHERFIHPRHRTIGSPTPKLWVWMELFLGKDGVLKLKEQYPYDEDGGFWGGKERSEARLEQLDAIYCELLDLKKYQKDIGTGVRVLVNVLRYLRNKSDVDECSSRSLLSFCSVYGLSGAMTDILEGKYGSVGKNLNINSILSMKDYSHIDGYSTLEQGSVILPPYIIGAVLGHTNVVKHALKELGGEAHIPYVMSMPHKDFTIKNAAASVLQWIVETNQPDMVRCLVTDCGFQFRWLGDGELTAIWRDLTEFSPYERVLWSGFKSIDLALENPVMCSSGGGGDSRWNRRRAAYKEKDKMLQTLIEVGLPMELLIPVDIDFSLDKEILEALPEGEEVSKADQDRYEEWQKSLPRTVQEARGKISQACSHYNWVQPTKCDEEEYSDDDEDNADEYDEENPPKKKSKSEKSMLHAHEFYERLKAMWKDQPMTQDARLSDYDPLDPRWVKEREAAEKKNGAEEGTT